MENFKQGGANLPPPAPQYRSHAVLPPQSPQIAPKTVQSETVSGSLWANVAAGVMTYQFATGTPAEWQWWAYGGMVGGYGLARRAIAAVQQTSEKKEK